MSEWIGTEYREPEHIGFVYIIRHKITGHYYIGQKCLTFHRTRPPLKGRSKLEKERRSKMKGLKRHYITESDWETYWGSSETFKQYVAKEGKENFDRVILSFHRSLFDLSYAELLQQLRHNVLYDPKAYNEIINVRLRKRK